jgi:hypothetical protein
MQYKISVADPGCLSRISDPDFCPSLIPNPTTQHQKGEKKIVRPTIFCSHQYHKIVNNFIF